MNNDNRILCISRWAETFENADTRKRERLKSFHSPSGCESTGYIELVTCHGSAGLMAFGVFQALCQLAATMPSKRRGRFVKSDQSAMPLRQIALLIRVEICHLEKAVEVLTNEEIGWLKWEEQKQQSADNLPTIRRDDEGKYAKTYQKPAEFVQGEGEGEGEATTTKRDPKLETNRPIGNPKPIVVVADDQKLHLTTETGKQFDSLMAKINSLHPSWRKRPHWSRREREAVFNDARSWFELSNEDWQMLTTYMDAAIPESWKDDPRDFPQPDNRMGLMSIGATNIMTYAERFQRKLQQQENLIKQTA